MTVPDPADVDTFVTAGRIVLNPGYQPVPFDEDLCWYLEGAGALCRVESSMTPDEFDTYCLADEWVGGPASVVRPMLDLFRKRDGQ